MKFAAVPLDQALGAVLAHGLSQSAVNFRKGRVLTKDDLTLLAKAGIAEITVARLGPGDVPEDQAAGMLGHLVAGAGVQVQQAFTGRVNLYAVRRGLLLFDRAALDRFNAIDEAVTLASLPAYEAVEARQMLATVKIIPFAVPRAVLDTAFNLVPKLEVRPYRDCKLALISTRLEGVSDKLLDKNRTALQKRLDQLAGHIMLESRVAHDQASVTAAIIKARADDAGLILIQGASAIVDRRDVIPSAILAAGGQITRFGMPVDPGNLLLLGKIGDTAVIGLPGCARSPKVNGFDFVLQRLLAGLDVTSADLAHLGAGGLLKEIAERPQPREQNRAPRIGAILLAAGRSTRMGAHNKLLAQIDGKPVLRHAADALIAAGLAPIITVTGHMATEIALALKGADMTYVHNPDFADGMASSLKTGLAALPPELDGVVIALGDMPAITAHDIARLIAAFDPGQSRGIVVPRFEGKRGNPVLFATRYVDDMLSLAGDTGARQVILRNAQDVVEVALDNPGILLDLDTPEALAAFSNLPAP